MTLLTKTIQQQFGITPDAEAVINYTGFTDIMKILGKVCMYVDENVTSIHIGHAANGKQAVPYMTDGAGIIKHKVAGRDPEQVQDRATTASPRPRRSTTPGSATCSPRTTATTAASDTSSSCSRPS